MKKKETFIDRFKSKGYTYMVRVGRTGEVWATKARMKKDGTFRLDANFDVYELDQETEYPYPDYMFISLK